MIIYNYNNFNAKEVEAGGFLGTHWPASRANAVSSVSGPVAKTNQQTNKGGHNLSNGTPGCSLAYCVHSHMSSCVPEYLYKHTHVHTDAHTNPTVQI